MALNKDQLKDLVKFMFLFIVLYVFLGLYESIIITFLWGCLTKFKDSKV